MTDERPNPGSTSERWRQVKEIFQTAIELPAGDRAACLDRACGADGVLRAEIESLLAAHQRPGSFLDSPLADFTEEEETWAGPFVGRYRILARLARGGMGEIYRANDPTLGRDVAIKILPRAFADDPDRLRRFEQEARAASALNHPNIITVHEFGQEAATYFIVTEWIEGETLRERLARGLLKPDEVLAIALQIGGALQAAHAAGIVHRDLKPENVMLRPDGLVKVLDFGLAKLQIEEEESQSAIRDSQSAIQHPQSTKPGLVMGTVNYMSPEQARGLKLDARTDLFSLGVVLYEMSTGRSPFAGETIADTFASLLEKDPPPIAAPAPDVIHPLERVIAKALRKDRDERYQTAQALLADLTALQRGEPPIAAPQPRGGVARLRRPAPAIAAAALLAIAALVASLVRFPNRDAIESIAVLPFVNVGGNPETEHLADSIGETLTNGLSRFPNLEVRPRNSALRYKGRGVDPQTAGRELDVEAVLTAAVAPRGETISISLELIDVPENRQIWGARHDRPLTELLSLQAEISRQLADALRLGQPDAGRAALDNRYTGNVEAYQAYSRGRYFWNKRTKEGFEKAIEHFHQASRIEPRYALAYSGLADCYFALATHGMAPAAEAFAKSKAAVKQALAIDDGLAEAHTTLAHITGLHDWDWAGAERGFQRALALNPEYPTAHQWYALSLASQGRHDEAVAEVRRAQTLDPHSLIILLDVARVYFYARQYDRTIELSLKATEMDPNYPGLTNWLRRAYEEKGLYDQAIEEYWKALTERGAAPKRLALYRSTYAASGWPGYWRLRLKETEAELNRTPIHPYYVAVLYARAGRNDQALEWLEKAYEQHSDLLTTLKVDPLFDRLRGDPRFTALLRRIGLAP
jgi:eukaryotic-like serine/threonine-protein kinase